MIRKALGLKPRRSRCASDRFAPARCLNLVSQKGEWCPYCREWRRKCADKVPNDAP
jgi:hypothetical protein